MGSRDLRTLISNAVLLTSGPASLRESVLSRTVLSSLSHVRSFMSSKNVKHIARASLRHLIRRSHSQFPAEGYFDAFTVWKD